MMYRLKLREFKESKKIRFLAVGVLNTIFGYVTYAVILFIGFPYPVALLLATILGIIFNYFNFKKIFFGHRDWLAFFKFLAVYGAVFGVNTAGLRLLVQEFLINPYLGQIICVPPSLLLSWSLMNYWVFRK
jgi:putative flippase GtrA